VLSHAAPVAPQSVAPCGSLPKEQQRFVTPKPAFIVSGEKDPRVSIDEQQKAIERIRQIDSATVDSQLVGNGRTSYESETGTPVMTLIHPGAHVFPPRAPWLIVEFFKAHKKSPRKT
jgi:polyhydroxybutyrate depolymerase